MNKLILCFFIYTLAACERKPYVEHKIQLDKKTEGCAELDPSFRMISNFGGERFEFEKCLPAAYDKTRLETSRQGDTVLIKFPSSGSPENTTYKVTLDIDSYPRYNFITIDEETYPITSSAN